MWPVVSDFFFIVSLSTLLGPALCTAHLFCVLGESLQRALRVHLPGAARPSLVQYQTSINLTTPALQTSDSACTDEGALNLELLMTNHCLFFTFRAKKSHSQQLYFGWKEVFFLSSF